MEIRIHKSSGDTRFGSRLPIFDCKITCIVKKKWKKHVNVGSPSLFVSYDQRKLSEVRRLSDSAEGKTGELPAGALSEGWFLGELSRTSCVGW